MLTFFTVLISLLVINVFLLVFSVNRTNKKSIVKKRQLNITSSKAKSPEVEIQLRSYKKAV